MPASQPQPAFRPASLSPSGLFRKAAALPAALAVGVLSVSVVLPAGNAQASLITGAASYLNLTASSVFGSGFEASQLVDGDLGTAWVLGGANGINPQGRDEGWFSFELLDDYVINKLYFAPRAASGTVDGVDRLQVWAGLNPFNVDVTDASSTAAFLATNLQPSFQVNGFAPTPNLPYAYDTGSMLSRYVLVRLQNSTDSRADRNMGARLFLLQGIPLVPGPVPVLGVASAFMASRRLRRRCRR